MTNIWFTADFHFSHHNILQHCHPPFDTVEQMNAAVLDRLNAVVKERDLLYFLGDFCLGSVDSVQFYLRQIRCKNIHVVFGNHDRVLRKLSDRFIWAKDLAEISVSSQKIVLCHYALRVWNRSHHGSWHLYGHSHGNLPEIPTVPAMDVGVDTHDFRPWHYEEIVERFQSRLSAQRTLEPFTSETTGPYNQT